VWGEKCLERETLRKTLGDSLLKQLTTEDVLDLLDKTQLQQSIINFPLTRSLDVKFLSHFFIDGVFFACVINFHSSIAC